MSKHPIPRYRALPVVAERNLPTFLDMADQIVAMAAECDDVDQVAAWRESALAWEEYLDRRSESRGPTGAAAAQTGRRFVGVELDAGRFATSTERLT